MERASDDKDILEMYGCDENPLVYMIESQGSVEIRDKNANVDPDDFENIL